MATDHEKLTKRANKKRIRNSRSSKNKFVAQRTVEQFFAMPERDQDIWTRVTHAVSKMRAEGVSLPRASREYGVTRRQMQRFGGKAMRKLKNGRYAARASDRLLRVLVIPTLEGLREIAVIDSRQATLLAEYWNAVHRYLEIGDDSALKEFHGMYITDASGAKVPLLTNIEEINRLGNAGVLSFESMYARTA